jgi:aryl-alcohol dehydrogenase-like predicted oxidoreductase
VTYRQLGSTGLRVSLLGVGCNRLGEEGRAGGRPEALRLLDCAADRGVTFFDTADIYVGGESERLLGEAFGRGRRDVIIATKIALASWRSRRLLAAARPAAQLVMRHAPWLLGSLRAGQARVRGFSPDVLRRSVEGSLRRLRRDRLDLLQLHSPPPGPVESGEVFDVLERMRAEGLIRFFGVAYGSWGERNIRLPEHGGVSTVQLPVDALDQGGAAEFLARAASRGLGVIANQPFRKGRLVASSSSVPVDGLTLAQAALRAVAQIDEVSVVLTGTTSLAHLRENLAALDRPPLASDELRRLRSTLTRIAT